jgi:uncharacterized protein (TIGR00299 family) protein
MTHALDEPGSPRVAWFHCHAGTAGDMTLASLIDAGADPDAVAAMLGGLHLADWVLSFERVQRGGIAATRALVGVHQHGVHQHHDHDHDGHHEHGHRPVSAIRELLDSADLPDRVRRRARAVIDALAEVEGAIHDTPPDDVELHEVGAVDAIVDIVGTCAALEVLGIDRVVCSPISVGRGTVRAAHGRLPHPTPAVVALAARVGAPLVGMDDPVELATPTGVALMTVLADEFGPLPAVNVTAVGYGAGSNDTPGRPNVVQVVIGVETIRAASPGRPARLLEANVDDVTPEVLAHTVTALLDAGAHDAWITPIVMKKGRPAHTVHALCDTAVLTAVMAAMVEGTGTLGVRATTVERWPQRRRDLVVHVDGHPVRVKAADHRIKVEFDDAAEVTRISGLPLRSVLAAAEAAARDALDQEISAAIADNTHDS